MSTPIKKETVDWEPLAMDPILEEQFKALIKKLSKVKVKHLTHIDGFDAWLIAITGALETLGLKTYLDEEARRHCSCIQQWVTVSKQIASWMEHHVDNTLIRLLKTRGDALTLADTFINRAKKLFGTGHIANQLRLKKFLAINPADFSSMSQFVTTYEEKFMSLRSHDIEMAPYTALLAMLLHIEQASKQVHDKMHLMLQTETDFAKSEMEKRRNRPVTTADLVTLEVFQDFASRTATLLKLDEGY
ncbi:uncharacterized protein N7503_010567 [Penicillium pulvis]|uniref:uncharacterized protein n=1 Tax=Penicillium pulvis TaxID=1562058 RepID=UPI0025474FD2|nr:uncharacterized protein N7503_010567 [Penicillium pulvis]KAJ5785355.1 hypothetical protein N7503_010567 [Penicillium pulvis]